MSTFILSNIEEFSPLTGTEDCPDKTKMINAIYEFWGGYNGEGPDLFPRMMCFEAKDVSLGFSELNSKIIDSLRHTGLFSRVFLDHITAHVAAMPELCEHLKIKFPDEEVAEFIECDKIDASEWELDIVGEVRELKIQKVKLEELSNEMLPYVFDCSKTVLEFKRAKAIWIIVLYELDKVNLKLKL